MAGCYGNHPIDKYYEGMLMNYLDNQDEEPYECNVCGCEIEHEGICDSKDCFKVDNEN